MIHKHPMIRTRGNFFQSIIAARRFWLPGASVDRNACEGICGGFVLINEPTEIVYYQALRWVSYPDFNFNDRFIQPFSAISHSAWARRRWAGRQGDIGRQKRTPQNSGCLFMARILAPIRKLNKAELFSLVICSQMPYNLARRPSPRDLVIAAWLGAYPRTRRQSPQLLFPNRQGEESRRIEHRARCIPDTREPSRREGRDSSSAREALHKRLD
ncbi:MAG: hypothetical protein ACYDC3_12440 [Candidatus Binataceae bacterium]